MVRQVTQSAFRPLEPLALPEGNRVKLRVEDEASDSASPRIAKIWTPKLASPEDAADFAMEVREGENADI